MYSACISTDAGFAAVFRSVLIPVKMCSIAVQTATRSSTYTSGCEAQIPQIITEDKDLLKKSDCLETFLRKSRLK